MRNKPYKSTHSTPRSEARGMLRVDTEQRCLPRFKNRGSAPSNVSMVVILIIIIPSLFSCATMPPEQKSGLYYSMGSSYLEKNQVGQAIYAFNKALEINPNNAPAYNNLAWLYATAKEPRFHNGEKAVELALKACELSAWNDPNYLNTLAAAYARKGDFNNAVK